MIRSPVVAFLAFESCNCNHEPLLLLALTVVLTRIGIGLLLDMVNFIDSPASMSDALMPFSCSTVTNMARGLPFATTIYRSVKCFMRPTVVQTAAATAVTPPAIKGAILEDELLCFSKNHSHNVGTALAPKAIKISIIKVEKSF